MNDTKTREAATAAEPPESSDDRKMTKLGEGIGEARTLQPTASAEPGDDKEPTGSAATTEAKKTLKFQFPLKISQPIWLIAATMFLGLVTLLIFGRATGRIKAAREKQVERSVESLTPEGLIAKCGQPAVDETKDLYPMIKRTMSYNSSRKGALTLEFSRTAEEKSDWVFLSLSDENGATYGTPETQIATMPCLNSRK